MDFTENFTVSISDLLNASQVLQNVFQREFHSYKPITQDKVNQILKEADDRRIIQADFIKGQISISFNQANKDILNFLRESIQSFVDAYLIVACAIKFLQQTGKKVEQAHFLNNLSLKIIELNEEG